MEALGAREEAVAARERAVEQREQACLQREHAVAAREAACRLCERGPLISELSEDFSGRAFPTRGEAVVPDVTNPMLRTANAAKAEHSREAMPDHDTKR